MINKINAITASDKFELMLRIDRNTSTNTASTFLTVQTLGIHCSLMRKWMGLPHDGRVYFYRGFGNQHRQQRQIVVIFSTAAESNLIAMRDLLCWPTG